MSDLEFAVVKVGDCKIDDTLLFANSHELIDYIDLNNIKPDDKRYKIYKLKEISFTKTIEINLEG